MEKLIELIEKGKIDVEFYDNRENTLLNSTDRIVKIEKKTSKEFATITFYYDNGYKMTITIS